jgi:putative tricarboxylic transport membrane protein
VLRRFDYPIAPVVVGLILGPLAEQQLRRALSISQGDASVLVSTPLSATLLALSALALLLPIILTFVARRRGVAVPVLGGDTD